MPKFVVAHKSGAHRIAAIALFRALLSQCNKLELPAHRRHELSNVIRCRFAGFRHTTSHRQLKLLFEAGYEAVDHLDAAVAGDRASERYVLDLLQRAPRNVKNGPLYRSEDAATCPPTTLPFLEHATPRERLGGSGQRHVPKIFSANCIPVLRMKKPQPLALTMYLDSRIKQRQKRHDLRNQLQEQVAIAAQEEEWDDILQTCAGIGRDDARTSEPSRVSPQQSRWDWEVQRALGQVHAYLNEEKAKNRRMAEKMYAVIGREESMAEQERQEDERRRREIAEGLEELRDMAGDIISPDDTFYRPLSKG
ncbi:hypothetical protein CERZMDRAFT_68576 [Cercospora zeae-maydis SCOH1-5]|uniref:Uncharacterized protein n=1 Tax=Cercospora zeae-maydis SCOH1-5 TaxID=717836 RepID=A0A6A6FDF5_9PEZI|nr:hypothetical protein CERZMDRAFT_68576 [Cercospora zeae-maydis SCOH1-5]